MMTQRTAMETVRLYIDHTSNSGNPDWVAELCADPILRHAPGGVTPMSHDEQRHRISEGAVRLAGPRFAKTILHGEGPYVTWVWDMVANGGDKRLCGIEVFRVVDGIITDVWNSSYMEGAWG